MNGGEVMVKAQQVALRANIIPAQLYAPSQYYSYIDFQNTISAIMPIIMIMLLLGLFTAFR